MLFANLMTVGIPFDHEIFRKIANKACFKKINVALLRCQTQMNLIRKLHGKGKGLVLNDEFNSVAPDSK